MIKIIEIDGNQDVPHERPKSSHGGNISKKLDLLYPEADRSP